MVIGVNFSFHDEENRQDRNILKYVANIWIKSIPRKRTSYYQLRLSRRNVKYKSSTTIKKSILATVIQKTDKQNGNLDRDIIYKEGL